LSRGGSKADGHVSHGKKGKKIGLGAMKKGRAVNLRRKGT